MRLSLLNPDFVPYPDKLNGGVYLYIYFNNIMIYEENQ